MKRKKKQFSDILEVVWDTKQESRMTPRFLLLEAKELSLIEMQRLKKKQIVFCKWGQWRKKLSFRIFYTIIQYTKNV